MNNKNIENAIQKLSAFKHLPTIEAAIAELIEASTSTSEPIVTAVQKPKREVEQPTSTVKPRRSPRAVNMSDQKLAKKVRSTVKEYGINGRLLSELTGLSQPAVCRALSTTRTQKFFRTSTRQALSRFVDEYGR